MIKALAKSRTKCLLSLSLPVCRWLVLDFSMSSKRLWRVFGLLDLLGRETFHLVMMRNSDTVIFITHWLFTDVRALASLTWPII